MAMSLLARKYLATLNLDDEQKRELLKAAKEYAGTDQLNRSDLREVSRRLGRRKKR